MYISIYTAAPESQKSTNDYNMHDLYTGRIASTCKAEKRPHAPPCIDIRSQASDNTGTLNFIKTSVDIGHTMFNMWPIDGALSWIYGAWGHGVGLKRADMRTA